MSRAVVVQNSERVICFSREYDAPRALVWKALTDPAHIGLWWGPDGFTTITKSIDVRPGGSWVYTMNAADGRQYPNVMTFREVVPQERLAYRHGTTEQEDPDHDFNVVVTLEDLGGERTRVTLTSTFATAEARERVVREHGAVEGGLQHLDKLAAHLRDLVLAA